MASPTQTDARSGVERGESGVERGESGVARGESGEGVASGERRNGNGVIV